MTGKTDIRRVAGAGLTAALGLSLLGSPALAVVAGQVDTFEDGAKGNWVKGQAGQTSATLTNIADGGPEGAGDNFLRNTSSGGGTAGGRMVMYNEDQWAGDYVDGQVTSIEVKVRNSSAAATLFLRIAISAGGTRFGSTNAIQVPKDGQWHVVNFGLSESSLTRFQGTASLAVVMANVVTLRLLSRQAAPGWQGDQVAAVLDVDDLMAQGPTPVEGTTWGRVKRLYGTSGR